MSDDLLVDLSPFLLLSLRVCQNAGGGPCQSSVRGTRKRPFARMEVNTECLLRDDHLRSGVRAKHRRHQKLKAGFVLRDIKREKAQN